MGAGKSGDCAKSRGTALGRAGAGKCGAHNYHLEVPTRLILAHGELIVRTTSISPILGSSNYQPDSSNYQLQADNLADNQAVSFVVKCFQKMNSHRVLIS